MNAFFVDFIAIFSIAMYVGLTSILIITIGLMGLRYWLDHGAKHMPARLREWLL